MILHLLSRLRMEKPEGVGAAGASGGDPEVRCPACKAAHRRDLLLDRLYICPDCGAYVRIPARDRIQLLADEGSFAELDETLTSVDFLSFPEYQNKLDKAKQSTGEQCATVSGVMQVQGIPCAVFAMDSRFVMASMGSAVGEKITRLFEYATENELPVLGILCSGGARMQEGIVSLMQMAKCSGAVRKHSDAGLLYLSLLTDPTTGGMTASIAMEGDVTLAEPKTLIGFAGRRVIEQTTGAELPKDFQTSEFLLDHGFVDRILPREEQRETIALLLRQHQKEIIPDG